MKQIRGLIRLKYATVERTYETYDAFIADLRNMGRMGYDIIDYSYKVITVIN